MLHMKASTLLHSPAASADRSDSIFHLLLHHQPVSGDCCLHFWGYFPIQSRCLMQQLFPLSNLLITLFEPHWRNLIKKALGGCCANVPVSTANIASPGSVAPTHRAANHPLSLVSHLAFTLSNLPPFDLTCLETETQTFRNSGPPSLHETEGVENMCF